MKKQNQNRKYNFPDADLYLQCIERIRYANRDIAQFQQYGYGKEHMANGHVYEGEKRQNNKHGKGNMTWSNGATYKGSFRDDKMHGKGT